MKTTTKIALAVSSLLVVLVLGLIALTSNQHKAITKLVEQHRKKLEAQDLKYLKSIDSLHTIITRKNLVVDSLNRRASSLEQKILANDKATAKKKEEVKNMTNAELVKFIVNRYSTSPK